MGGQAQRAGLTGFVQGLTHGVLKQQEREEARRKRREEFDDKVKFLEAEAAIKARIPQTVSVVDPNTGQIIRNVQVPGGAHIITGQRERQLLPQQELQQEFLNSQKQLEQVRAFSQQPSAVAGGRLFPGGGSNLQAGSLLPGEQQAIQRTVVPFQQTARGLLDQAQQQFNLVQQRAKEYQSAFGRQNTLTQTEQFRADLQDGIEAVRGSLINKEKALKRLKDKYPDKARQIEEVFLVAGI